MSAIDSIRQLATDYFDGLYAGDTAKLGSIFHPRARLHVVTDGKLVETELPAYLKIVEGRASPESQKSERRDEVLSISLTSPDAAVLVVRLLLAGKDYTDQLALVRDGGRWQIMSKIFYLNGQR